MKLEHYIVRRNIFGWVKRSQDIVVKGIKSTKLIVISGVPQGSVLWPLLFFIHINDMSSSVSSSIALFADDSFLFRKISSENDGLRLQNDLDNTFAWEQNRLMEFHPEKCKVLRVTNKRKGGKVFGSYSLTKLVLEIT